MNRRKMLAGGAAALPLAVAGVSTASPIAELFQQWQENGATSLDGMGDADGVAVCDEYRRLQVAIVAATPRTPRDLAMQFWCDSDGGCSSHSADFLDRMRALAGVVEAKA